MSNEEVVLRMLINRLEQMLEAIPEMKAKWGAEITEIIHLGKGVIVDVPERHAVYHATQALAYDQDSNGDWHMPLTREMIEGLMGSNLENMSNRFMDGLQDLFDGSQPEPDYDDDDGDDDPINDEPLPAVQAPDVRMDAAWWRAQINGGGNA